MLSMAFDAPWAGLGPGLSHFASRRSWMAAFQSLFTLVVIVNREVKRRRSVHRQIAVEPTCESGAHEGRDRATIPRYQTAFFRGYVVIQPARGQS